VLACGSPSAPTLDEKRVGRAIVREIEKLGDSPDLVKRVGEFARSLVAPTD
jgi:hypothetical protein